MANVISAGLVVLIGLAIVAYAPEELEPWRSYIGWACLIIGLVLFAAPASEAKQPPPKKK